MTKCPKHILDFWEAYSKVETLPSPWLQTATECAQLEQLISIQAAKAGIKDYEAKNWHAFMPPDWIPPKTELGEGQSDEELDAIIKRFV